MNLNDFEIVKKSQDGDEYLVSEGQIIIHKCKSEHNATKLVSRIIENEKLRGFIINLRDNPQPITAEQVIENLTSFTEDLKP